METARIIMRDWREEDIPFLVAMHKDKQVMRYFPRTRTEEESVAYYHKIRKELKDNGFGPWVMESKETGEFQGFVSLRKANFEEDFTPCVEIGWRLRKEFWHKGYACEAAKACLQYGFETLGLSEIYSFASVINTPSVSVMKRIDMHYVKEFEMHSYEESSLLKKHVLYKIDKSAM